MSPSPIYFLLAGALVLAQLILPRRFAFVPLLAAVCHFQSVAVIDVGVAFTVCKLVIIAGFLRATRDNTFASLTRQPLDVIVVIWAGWMILSGFAHHPKDHNPITIRLSTVFDFVGAYFYTRCFLKDQGDFLRFLKCLAVLMVPLAVEAAVEKTFHQNYYGVLSGNGPAVFIRDGRPRAQGPFAHAILLGTFAATAMIIMLSLWHQNRRWMKVGISACAVTVVCSASSGPLMALFAGLSGVALWRWRSRVPLIRTFIILGLVALHLVMNAPVWYLMARVDLAGGSTGWHRAALIDAAINHFSDWWLVGTDYTRDWIAYGVPWSEYHVDITNHYIAMGVSGGLLLMLCFIAILRRGFQLLGLGMVRLRQSRSQEEFILWCAGAALFAHTVAFISVSYFDQSIVWFAYFLGALPGLCALSSASVSSAIDGDTQQMEFSLPAQTQIGDARETSAPISYQYQS